MFGRKKTGFFALCCAVLILGAVAAGASGLPPLPTFSPAGSQGSTAIQQPQAATQPQLVPQGTTAVVNNPNPKDRLNLRTSASTSAGSLGKYYNGVTVQILEDNPATGWAKVQIGNRGTATGYMLRQYLAFGDAQYRVASAIPIYMTTGSAWELLDAPWTNSIYNMYGVENNIELLGFIDGWWHVRIREYTGYVSSRNGFQLVSGNPNFDWTGESSSSGWSMYYDGYRIAIVNNPNAQDRLYLRKEANSNALSYGKYYNGTVVALLSEVQNGWVKAKIGNLEGYMQSQYLKIDGTVGSVTSAQPTATVNVSQGKTLTLREGKSTSTKSLGEYGRGKTVTVMGLDDMGSGGLWYHVVVDGKVGFMSAAYLTPQLPYHLP